MDRERHGYEQPVAEPSDPIRDTERYAATRDALRDAVSSNVPPSRRERRRRRTTETWWRRAITALRTGSRG